MRAYTTLSAPYLAVALVLLTGCAGSGSSDQTALSPGGIYQLSAEEQDLDCKSLTGRMQVRILQIRDHETQSKSTAAARTMQSASTQVFGGSTFGADPDAQYAKDRAMLEAYNKQLAAKDCSTFDLASELMPKPITATPAPVPKPKDTPANVKVTPVAKTPKPAASTVPAGTPQQ